MTKTMAYITDVHLDEAYPAETGVNARDNWNRILSDVQARGIRSIIFGGDIGEPTANAWFFESLQDYDLQLTLGNHDTFAEVRQHVYKEEWKNKAEGYYALEDEHFKYVFLDSSNNAISITQRVWLEEAITTPKQVLLFIHHPIFPIHTPVDKLYPLQEREALQQLLKLCNVPVTIFCGHYHMPDEQTIGLIQQYVTPAASYQIVKDAPELAADATHFGYRILYLDADTLTTEVVTFKAL